MLVHVLCEPCGKVHAGAHYELSTDNFFFKKLLIYYLVLDFTYCNTVGRTFSPFEFQDFFLKN